jgi:hypothetical protein
MLGSQKNLTLYLKGLQVDQSIHKISVPGRLLARPLLRIRCGCGRKSAGAILGYKKAPEFPPGLSLSVNH